MLKASFFNIEKCMRITREKHDVKNLFLSKKSCIFATKIN